MRGESLFGAHGPHTQRDVQTALRLAARRCNRPPLRAGGAARAVSTQRPPVEAGGGSGGAKKWLCISYPLLALARNKPELLRAAKSQRAYLSA
jgi:hypothetical protein